jgi:hypothetical protein
MERTRRMFVYLNGDNAFGNGRSVAMGWGAAHVAACLAIAYLNDQEECATVAAIARLSGQGESAAGDKLRTMVGYREMSPIHRDMVKCPRCGGAKPAYHYRTSV